MIIRPAKEWLGDQVKTDEVGIAFALGGTLKLAALVNLDVLPATLVAIVAINIVMIGRALLGTRKIPHRSTSVGMRPALAIAAVVSVLLLLPLGRPGCYVAMVAGIVIIVAQRIPSVDR